MVTKERYQFKGLLQRTVFQDGNFSSLPIVNCFSGWNFSSVDGFLSVVGHPFLRLT